jgi:hypothetical protein
MNWQGQLAVVAEDCDQPDIKKLVEALCAEHGVQLLSVPESKQLGQWAGVLHLPYSPSFFFLFLTFEGNNKAPHVESHAGTTLISQLCRLRDGFVDRVSCYLVYLCNARVKPRLSFLPQWGILNDKCVQAPVYVALLCLHRITRYSLTHCVRGRKVIPPCDSTLLYLHPHQVC